ADYGNGLGRAHSMERERLLLGAAGEVLRVLRIPFIEHLPREVAERLPAREPHGDVGDSLIRPRQVMCRHPDGPLLRLGHLPPIRFAQLLKYTAGLLSLGLALSGE